MGSLFKYSALFFIILIVRATAIDDTESIQTTDKYFHPGDIATCSQKSTVLNDCVQNIFQTVLERLKDGNKQLNIPSLDPLKLNRTTFNYKSSSINGKITIKDSEVHGMSESKIRKVDMKLDGNKIQLNLLQTSPLWYIQGNYKADFLVNNLRLKPKGTFNLTVFDSQMDVYSAGELFDKDNHRFVRLSSYDIIPKVNDIKFNATGLFADPALNELALNVVNQYWRQIFELIVPQLRQFLAPTLMSMLNEVLSIVPFDEYVKDAK